MFIEADWFFLLDTAVLTPNFGLVIALWLTSFGLGPEGRGVPQRIGNGCDC
jgi:hypothetical protein